jgi:hypothetical protein
MFWRVFAIVSLYVVDMIAFYTITLFEYLSLYIKTDKIHLTTVTYCVVVVISQHLLNVFVQLANKRGLKKNLLNIVC